MEPRRKMDVVVCIIVVAAIRRGATLASGPSYGPSEKDYKKARALTHFNETIPCKLYSHGDLLQACQCPNSVLMRPVPVQLHSGHFRLFLPPRINRWKCPLSPPAIASLPPSAEFPRSKTFFLLLGYENAAQNSTGH